MKKINEVYKEVENEKENEVKEKTVTMSLDDFTEEHTNLIEVLRNGTPAEREAEAKRQEKELAEEVGEEESDDEEVE